MTGQLSFAQNFPARELAHDFDHSGKPERLVTTLDGPQIQIKNSTNGTWEKADFNLPDGVQAVDGRGVGLNL